MRRCAVLLPGEEDFGIVPVEAQSCGTPVVALGRGGALETVIDGETGVLFDEPTAASMADALERVGRLHVRRHTSALPRRRSSHASGTSSALRAVIDETTAAPAGTRW